MGPLKRADHRRRSGYWGRFPFCYRPSVFGNSSRFSVDRPVWLPSASGEAGYVTIMIIVSSHSLVCESGREFRSACLLGLLFI